MNITTLATNLHAYAYAARYQEKLTPSLFGSRVYAYGIQKKLLDLIYLIFQRLKEERLWEVAWEINWAIDRWAEKKLDRIEAYQWNQWIRPLVNGPLKEEHGKIGKIFRKQLRKDPFLVRWKELKDQGKRVSIYLKISQLRKFASSFPEEELRSICEGGDVEDQTPLIRWIERLHVTDVDVRTFHLCLKAFFENEENQQTDLSYLEWHLKDLGCRVFDQKDEKQLAWIEGVKKELRVIHALGSEIMLEKPIDKTLLFHIQNQPNFLIDLAENLASKALEEREMQAHPLENLKPAPLISMDPKGRFKMIEKKYPTLASLEITEEITHALVEFFKELQKKNTLPSGLSSETLYYDCQEKIFRSLKFWKIEPFNYARAEKLAWDLAGQDHKRAAHLMEESSLMNHPIAKFLRKVTRQAIQYGISPETIDCIANQNGIVDPSVRLRAKELATEFEVMIKNGADPEELLDCYDHSGKMWHL